IDRAFQKRVGYSNMLRRGTHEQCHFGLRIDFHLSETGRGYYSVRIRHDSENEYTVEREKCVIQRPEPSHYLVEGGVLVNPRQAAVPRLGPSYFFLPYMSPYPEFAPVQSFISQFSSYNVSPKHY